MHTTTGGNFMREHIVIAIMRVVDRTLAYTMQSTPSQPRDVIVDTSPRSIVSLNSSTAEGMSLYAGCQDDYGAVSTFHDDDIC